MRRDGPGLRGFWGEAGAAPLGRRRDSQAAIAAFAPHCPIVGNLGGSSLPRAAAAHDCKLQFAALEVGPDLGAATTATLTDEARLEI